MSDGGAAEGSTVRVQARFALHGGQRDDLAQRAAELIGALHELAALPGCDVDVSLGWGAAGDRSEQ